MRSRHLFHPSEWRLSKLTLVLVLLASTGCSRSYAAPLSSPGAGGAPRALNKASPTRADRLAWREIVHWPDTCELGFNYPDEKMGGLEFFPLGDRRSLLQVCCTLGAYQGTYRYYRLDESRSPPTATELTFTTYVDSGTPGPGRLEKEQTTEVLGEPRFVAESKRLVILNKFRGAGDCGMLSTYSLLKPQPELVEVHAALNCGQRKAPKDPGRWPSLRVKNGQLLPGVR